MNRDRKIYRKLTDFFMIRTKHLIAVLVALSTSIAATSNAITVELVKDIQSGSGGSFPLEFAEFGGNLFFAADDGTNGTELWVSDGTESGTQLLKNIQSGSGGSFPFGFTEFGGNLFFRANDGTNGTELWVTDGTESGTQLLKDIHSGSGSSIPSGAAAPFPLDSPSWGGTSSSVRTTMGRVAVSSG